MGFPVKLKRANGVPVVRGAIQPSLVEFSGLLVVGCRSRRRGPVHAILRLEYYCKTVIRIIHCVLKLFRLPLAALTNIGKIVRKQLIIR